MEMHFFHLGSDAKLIPTKLFVLVCGWIWSFLFVYILVLVF